MASEGHGKEVEFKRKPRPAVPWSKKLRSVKNNNRYRHLKLQCIYLPLLPDGRLFIGTASDHGPDGILT